MLKTEDLKLIYNPEPESLNPGALHHEVLCSKLHSGLLHLHSSRTDTVDSLRAAHGARRRSLKPRLSHKLGFGSQFCFSSRAGFSICSRFSICFPLLSSFKATFALQLP